MKLSKIIFGNLSFLFSKQTWSLEFWIDTHQMTKISFVSKFCSNQIGLFLFESSWQQNFHPKVAQIGIWWLLGLLWKKPLFETISVAELVKVLGYFLLGHTVEEQLLWQKWSRKLTCTCHYRLPNDRHFYPDLGTFEGQNLINWAV